MEVACPVCGSVQHEPRRVVTTFCRKCGEHLRIEKQRVIASSQVNPVPSSLYPAEQDENPVSRQPSSSPDAPPAPLAAEPPTTPQSSPTEKTSASAPAISNIKAEPELELLGFGNMMGFQEEENGDVTFSEAPLSKPVSAIEPPEKAPEPPVAELKPLQAPRMTSPVVVHPPALDVPAPVAAAPAPQPQASTFQKMREQGLRQQYFKDVECFDCGHKFKVGRSAKSTQCPSCSATVCLEDMDINMASTMPICTRGDVLIRKNGNVDTSEIRCRDLRVHGTVSANIHCFGDLIMRTSGTMVGDIHCRRFVVEKGSDIQFMNIIVADEVEISSRIIGNIQSNGAVLITSTGWVQGDVTARAVNIEPGGQLDGAMNILRMPLKPKPTKS